MRSILLAIILVTGLSMASCGSLFSDTRADEAFRNWTLEETYLITAAEGQVTYLEVLTPVSYGYQTVGEVEVSGADTHQVSRQGKLALVSAKVRGTGEEQAVTITYDVALSKGTVIWKDAEEDTDLLPGKHIQSDDPLIVATTEKLQTQKNAYQTAKDLSSFVSSTLQFDYSPKINHKQPTVMETLSSKKGVCADYANLTTALLRASGIRARSISGLVLKELSKAGEWNHQAGSHAWVEFLADDQWHFADPTWGNGLFDHPDGYHLSFGGADDEAELYDNLLKKYERSDSTIIGAMSAPLKFVCASEDENAVLIPSGTVKPLQ